MTRQAHDGRVPVIIGGNYSDPGVAGSSCLGLMCSSRDRMRAQVFHRRIASSFPGGRLASAFSYHSIASRASGTPPRPIHRPAAELRLGAPLADDPGVVRPLVLVVQPRQQLLRPPRRPRAGASANWSVIASSSVTRPAGFRVDREHVEADALRGRRSLMSRYRSAFCSAAGMLSVRDRLELVADPSRSRSLLLKIFTSSPSGS